MKKLSIVLCLCSFCLVSMAADDWKLQKELYDAIKKNDTKKMEEILTKQPSFVKKEIKYHSYPVLNAAELRATKALKLLVEKGANINQKDKNGNTVLHYLVTSKMKKAQLEEALDFCVKQKGMNIDIKNKEGKTPFLYSCSYSKYVPGALSMIPVIEVFSTYKVNLNAQDATGKAMLHYLAGDFALKKPDPNKTDLVKALAPAKLLAGMKGVNVNLTDKLKRTPLVAFLAHVQKIDDDKKVDFITCLMENGAKTNIKSKKKESALKLVEKKSAAYKAMKKK